MHHLDLSADDRGVPPTSRNSFRPMACLIRIITVCGGVGGRLAPLCGFTRGSFVTGQWPQTAALVYGWGGAAFVAEPLPLS